jgi:hypothetical protein
MWGLGFEVGALAALGRTAEVEAPLREASSLASEGRTSLRTNAGDWMSGAANEYLAHGHASAARAALEQAEAR